MLFNSLSFAIFLPIVFLLYWFVMHKNLKLQNILLLVSSYFFYSCWDWRFLFLLIFSTLLDYFTGIKMSDAKNQNQKKVWFLISVIINLGFLGFFKYYNFFIESFTAMLTEFGLKPNPYTLKIILPVGISFYTFHGLSYVIDIYRSRIKAEKNFIDYSVFVCFFPLLVAGPIERATHLLPQVKSKRVFSNELFNEGILQIAVGLFRKIVIADSLAKYVDVVYGNPDIYNSITLILGTVFYAFQIYYDFSGYSDIAIGTSKLFGFKLLQNFRLPYFSTSITEFWRKWHMSLSFWLRDYLYIELGGNRSGILKTYRNLFLTMLLGGLWHGSNWTFVVWGGIHGLFLSIEKYLNSTPALKFLKQISFLGYIYTFIVVCFAWIYFRASDISSANLIMSTILNGNLSMPFIGDITVLTNAIVVLLIGIAFDLYLRITNQDLEYLGNKLTSIQLITLVSGTVILITLFYSNSNNFIYFQF
jgi:alginate O-acetyltransferase complex protein AlgI